ncbi:MAG: hypothetical protein HYX69_08705 [Planctomycetia bacterium]|nr:hypothetical protein [Planctomycetia bacterium]
MRDARLTKAILVLALAAAAAPAAAQITTADMTFLRLSARTNLQAFQERGGDPKQIASILEAADKTALSDKLAFYRGYTKALALMRGAEWNRDAELATALDFTINAKVLGPGDMLRASATWLFDASTGEATPYRVDLDILKPDESKEASFLETIQLTEGPHAGEFSGVAFEAAKFLPPGLHLIRGTLKDGRGTSIYEFYRSFFIVPEFDKRLAALEKTVELLPDQQNAGALTARYVLDIERQAHQTYLGGAYQNLIGYLHTGYRARGFARSEVMDFGAELDRATKMAAAVQDGSWTLGGLRGDQKLAYRSTFDGRLVPYRIYVPLSYDGAKKYPLAVLLHGAGGDENSFFDGYQHLWPKLAEERGYILVAANGRGPLSGYTKESGAEQDMLDLLAIAAKNFSIDPARTYLAGHSMGAAGTWRLGLLYRDRFAALAPLAGTRMTPLLEAGLSSGNKIPLVIVAGGKDALVPVQGCRDASEKATSLGFDVKYREYPEEDHISVVPASVTDVFDFFDAHRKDAP